MSQCASDALVSWLTVKPYVRTLVRKAEESDFECERLWSQHARQLILGVETAAAHTVQHKSAPEVVFRLKRLLTSVFSAQSQRHDIAFAQHETAAMLHVTSASAEELALMAQVVKARDLLGDAAQTALRNSADIALRSVRAVASDSKDDARARARTATPSVGRRAVVVGSGYVRPHSAHFKFLV